jgi:hypothetical protein
MALDGTRPHVVVYRVRQSGVHHDMKPLDHDAAPAERPDSGGGTRQPLVGRR